MIKVNEKPDESGSDSGIVSNQLEIKIPNNQSAIINNVIPKKAGRSPLRLKAYANQEKMAQINAKKDEKNVI